jgi:hypothetical protein
MWDTVDCQWLLAGTSNEQYRGRTCTPRSVPLDTLMTGPDGALQGSFTVPDDFGFAHNVSVVDDTGVLRNRALFDVAMQVSVTPTDGPVGTPITLEVKGMGVQTMEDTRAILYDNQYTGFLSAVTTRGTARATIPATGQPGQHIIDIDRGAYTFPYLNPLQSPRPDIPAFKKTFKVTTNAPLLPPDVAVQNPAVSPAQASTPSGGATLTTSISAGPVGSDFTIWGEGLPPNQAVSLLWQTVVGNRVSGQGWDDQSAQITRVTTGGDGSLSFEAAIPPDVGGDHQVQAVLDGNVVAQTSVRVLPHAEPLMPNQGPTGTPLDIHLTGVGWTATANIYTLVYDNGYVGYACGFNSQGTVDIPLTVSGAPGWHFIDLYPAIYQGQEEPGRDNFRIPQLTYAADHPGEDLPAFHYAFLISPSD